MYIRVWASEYKSVRFFLDACLSEYVCEQIHIYKYGHICLYGFGVVRVVWVVGV